MTGLDSVSKTLIESARFANTADGGRRKGQQIQTAGQTANGRLENLLAKAGT